MSTEPSYFSTHKIGFTSPYACESADYDPDDFESLILFLHQRGAAGIIGPQCAWQAKLADAFFLPFFAQFFTPNACWESLFAAHRQLLYDHLDPRELANSLRSRRGKVGPTCH
jgi:hypothetical protein